VNVDLQQFCDEECENGRYSIAKPFVKSGYLYATDARIVVRVRTSKRQGNGDKKKTPDVAGLWKDEFESSAKFVPLPTDLRALSQIKCGYCDGKKSTVCKECGHRKKCEKCRGIGRLAIKKEWVEIGINLYDVKYYRLIKRLPNVKVAIPKSKHRRERVLSFKFDGGEGMLAAGSRSAIQRDGNALNM
jgi:hypothetical protein